MSKKQVIIFCAALILLVAGTGAYFMMQTPASNVVALEPEKVLPGDYTLGDPNAKVLVIEYASPSCTACAQWQKDVFPQLKQAYIDTGKVLYIYRFYPIFPPQDGYVAKMAVCLPREQFFPFIDMMYRNQPQWDKAEYPEIADPDAALARMGAIAGLSAERVAQCIAPNPAVDDPINAEAARAQAKFSITGTPTFVVDDVVGPRSHIMSFEEMRVAIDAALARK